MEIAGLIPIWVTTPYVDEQTDVYQSHTVYINKRKFVGNIQENFSELDVKIYGEILNQMQKIYTNTPPPIAAKDSIYFAEPIAVGTIEIGGVSFDIYPKGVAVAFKPKSQYINVSKPINPTCTNIKFEPLISEVSYA